MTHDDARNLCGQFGIERPLRDFHAMPNDQVERILAAADCWKYRKPRNANGSRARYFHAYLSRALAKSK